MSFRVLRNENGSLRKENFPTAMKLASEQHMRLVSAKSSDNSLVHEMHWTGDIVIHPTKGGKFKDKIVYEGGNKKYVLDDPRFLDLENVALFVQSGTYKLIDDGKYTFIVPNGEERVLQVSVIFNFPDNSGGTHPTLSSNGLPVNGGSGDFEVTAMLHRNDFQTISPVVRSSSESGFAIHVDQGFENRHAIILED